MPRGFNDGSITQLPDGRWLARKRYSVNGHTRQKKRVGATRGAAVKEMNAIVKEIEGELAGEVTIDRTRTFADLVTLAKKRELKPAEYSGETKVAGLRSWKTTEGHLKPLEEWFGKMTLQEISYDDLDEYRLARLKLPTIHDGRRSITSVNRELALARRLFFIAVRERWISDHPFHRGRPLIQTSAEVSRMRIISFAEEERLLEQCTGRRDHLRRQIIFAIETGMRRNEQLTLKLSDVDFTDRIITLRAFNSKTAKPRVIPIFERLARELEAALVTRRGARPDDLLFVDGCPRHAFENACADAGIDGLRWHDLRHTAATRMLHTYGLQTAEVMKILGHDNLKTFLRYLTFDREMATSIRERVDAARAALPAGPSGPSGVWPYKYPFELDGSAEAAIEVPASEPFDAGEVTEVPQ